MSGWNSRVHGNKARKVQITPTALQDPPPRPSNPPLIRNAATGEHAKTKSQPPSVPSRIRPAPSSHSPNVTPPSNGKLYSIRNCPRRACPRALISVERETLLLVVVDSFPVPALEAGTEEKREGGSVNRCMGSTTGCSSLSLGPHWRRRDLSWLT
ncbi:hypothetical protein PoB_007419400 [Plakobranchus ocellatus]|uniref:Uncharacterized protein n=1 Tax=Plakobranchus ocellatus TaxID=259542 RepID=A0AAV4DU53_9GAST|nr:hypothetical protein PoB_007419400 [Plakobranchus ocellatus]